MASPRRNVHLLKIGADSFGDGSQDICKDTESNLGLFDGFFKAEIIKKARFILAFVPNAAMR